MKLNTKKGIKLKKNYSIKIPLKENSYEVIVGTNIINKYKNKIFSTIKNANRILVMEDGKIVQSGTHESLMASSGLYQKYYEMQFIDLKAKENIEGMDKDAV